MRGLRRILESEPELAKTVSLVLMRNLRGLGLKPLWDEVLRVEDGVEVVGDNMVSTRPKTFISIWIGAEVLMLKDDFFGLTVVESSTHTLAQGWHGFVGV